MHNELENNNPLKIHWKKLEQGMALLKQFIEGSTTKAVIPQIYNQCVTSIAFYCPKFPKN